MPESNPFPEVDIVGKPVDWSAFDATPEMFVTCKCWAKYQSHARILMDASGHPEVHTRKRCPVCGGTTTAKLIDDKPQQ